MNNTKPCLSPIKIIIQKNNQEISLRQLLAENKCIVQGDQVIAFQITVPADITCALADDLVGACAQDIKIILQQNSVVKYTLRHPGFVSGSTCQKNLTFIFAGQHAQAFINGLYHGKADKKLKLNITQDHQASHTSSACLIKSVLEDLSSLKCACLIKVGKECAGVVAEQKSKTLMLGQNVRAVVIPQLEIESYDSQCRHGATMSSISEQDIFYLQSRGLDQIKAKQLLLDAFLK